MLCRPIIYGTGDDGLDRLERRRCVLMAGPVLVPLSMAGAFTVLSRLLGPRRGYNAGFTLYWAGWCFAFPLWTMGGKRSLRLLTEATRLSGVDAVSLMVPLAGAVATELIPDRRAIDLKVAGVMAGSAVVNAVGEELLWRGAYLEAFPDDVWRGAIWPWAGFTLWHLAPQMVFPSRHGRIGFLGGAALVGAASARVTWKSRGLRWTLGPHILTDACGVRAALLRLGRTDENAGRSGLARPGESAGWSSSPVPDRPYLRISADARGSFLMPGA